MATRGKVLFPAAAAAPPGMGRATCSSTMKDAKFPSALDLAPGATDAEGPAAMRVCPYTYCSLNGHTHAPAVPLRSFLASRRRLIKTQQSMKHKGVSAFRKGTGQQRPEEKTAARGVAKAAPSVDDEALGDFFVEVYTGPRLSSDMSCSDMSLDEMDATVKRMEFVVFDRCCGDEDNEKGGDLAVRGDGERRLDERLGVCGDTSSECSDVGISGNLVEELPWMRYQGYECDSLDDVSEEQGAIHDEQEGEDEESTSGEFSDEHEDEVGEESESKDETSILDLPCEPGIIMEEEGVDCRVEASKYGEGTNEGNIILDPLEASTGQETQNPADSEECISEVAHKMEVASEQACIVCTMEVCKEQEGRDEDDILGEVCQGDTYDEQGTSQEKLSEGVCELEIPEYGAAQRVENVREGTVESSADQEEKDDETNMDSASKLEVTEKQNMKDDDESEIRISETVSNVECKGDFFEEEVTSKTVLECEVSDSSAIGSPDVEILAQQTECGFEQDVRTVEDAFEQHDIPADNTVDGTKDIQNGLTACKSEDASEESGIAGESSQGSNSICVDAAAQIEPDITKCAPDFSSEESSIVEESCQSDKAAYVKDGAQIEPEFATCQLEDASKESIITEETVRDDNSSYLGEGTQMQLGIGASELEGTSEESGIAHEIGEYGSSAYASDDAQSDSGITTCELEDVSEGPVAVQDYSCADVSGGSQNESELTPCDLVDASKGCDITQEAIQDENAADVNDDAQKESEIIACESEPAPEELDITQEGDEGDYTAGVCAGALKESEIITCEPANTCEEVSINEKVDLSSIGQNREHNYDISATDGHVEPQNLPAEDTVAKESSVDDICVAFSGMNLKGDVFLDPTESEISPRNRLIIARRRRTPEEDEYMRGFNPRAPNFLPLELDPDSEKVDLKHQTAEDRKNAEEWMIDYALRRAVNNLGPARKKKVELLVQAFETVLPHDEDEKKSITPTRSIQACN